LTWAAPAPWLRQTVVPWVAQRLQGVPSGRRAVQRTGSGRPYRGFAFRRDWWVARCMVLVNRVWFRHVRFR